MVGRQKNRAAIDPAGETDADRLALRDLAKPLRDLVRERSNVSPANLLQIGGESVALRIEKAGVGRVRIGTSDELNLNHMMRRHHARVAGMELAFKPLGLQPRIDGVDPLRHDERGALRALGQKVAHGAVHGASHADHFPGAGDQGKGAVDFTNRLRRSAEHPVAGGRHGHVVNPI